jgi:tetratricopeptide (TPR) repeat protein
LVSPHARGSGPGAAADFAVNSSMIPSSIGRYRIISTLGEGGMGTVYEAEQDHPNRRVALKVIRPGLVSAPEILRRFSRETEVLGRLQHPGIAQIYEAGTTDGPTGPLSFFAMELVRGESLTEHATNRSLALSQRLDLFARICDAVHYAHQQGVIHRDLKPANILVDSSGQPKILDFGVARVTDADVLATKQTSVGEVVGTLQYMSPEQVNADPDDIDIRSDVYTLGVILYELLAGRLPYDLSQKLIYEAAKVILVDDPLRISSINRRLGGDVEIIVSKALAKEKTRRYDSAAALSTDIRRFLRDEPIVARPTSALYQLRKFARRHRALVTGIGLAVATLFAGAVVSTWQAVRATTAERAAETRRNEAVASSELAELRRALADSALSVADSARALAQVERTAAVQSAIDARGEAAKAQAVIAFLQNMLTSSDPANARGDELSVREVLDLAAARIATDPLSREPEVKAAVQSTIGRTYFALGLYDQARPHFDSAYAIRRRYGARSQETGESADDLGRLALATGEYELAEARFREALASLRSTLPETDDRMTTALASLGTVRYQRGSFDEAEQLYRRALDLTRSHHGNTGTEVAQRLRALGTFLSHSGRAPQGQPLLEESLTLVREAYGTNHPQVVDAMISLGDAQLQTPDYAAAERTFREALPIARALYGQEHPSIADVLGRLGSALASQHNVVEAEQFNRDALAIRIKLLGERHPDVQLARTELARYYQAEGRFAEADTLYTQALEARRAVLGEMSPAVASSLMDLGMLANAQEDWPEAEALFGAATPIWKAANIEDQQLFAEGMLGWVLGRQEKLDEAEALLTRVLERRRSLFGETHWFVGDAYEKLAAVVGDAGRPVEAESLSIKGLAILRAVYGPRSRETAYQLLNVAAAREMTGDTAGALPLIRESLDISEASGTPTDAVVIAGHRLLATNLCATGAAEEGYSIIRSAIANIPLDTTQTAPYRARATEGFCLIRLGRFAEAERVMLEAESGLAKLPPAKAARYRATTVGWLVSLYEQWGKPEPAAVWRARAP